VEGIGEKKVFADSTRTLELHHIIDPDPENVHSDGIVVAFLPKERILFQADFTPPAAGQTANPFTRSLAGTGAAEPDFDTYLGSQHALQQTKADR
jgi:hypothetical protein